MIPVSGSLLTLPSAAIFLARDNDYFMWGFLGFFLPFVLLCISLSLPELSNFLYLLSESSKGLT